MCCSTRRSFRSDVAFHITLNVKPVTEPPNSDARHGQKRVGNRPSVSEPGGFDSKATAAVSTSSIPSHHHVVTIRRSGLNNHAQVRECLEELTSMPSIW